MKKNKRGAPRREAPTEGTELRKIYDLFQANKGLPVEYQTVGNTTAIIRLTDFYGLDIRRIQSGSCRTGRKSIYLLAGEWFGRVYVDYVAERVHAATSSQGREGRAA